MNTTSFVQLDDALAFNPGHITRVRFGYERMTICRVTVSFVDGVSFTLINEQFASFLEWWNDRAIVLTPGSMMTYDLLSDEDIPGSNDDPRDSDALHFIRGQQVPEAPEM